MNSLILKISSDYANLSQVAPFLFTGNLSPNHLDTQGEVLLLWTVGDGTLLTSDASVVNVSLIPGFGYASKTGTVLPVQVRWQKKLTMKLANVGSN